MSNQQPDEIEPKIDPAPEMVSESQPSLEGSTAAPEEELVSATQPGAENSTVESVSHANTTPPETEWIPGEQLELIKIPAPTIWPATLALGTTGIAFGVVTHWILSVAGLFLFLLGAKGWIEDLRNDVLQ